MSICLGEARRIHRQSVSLNWDFRTSDGSYLTLHSEGEALGKSWRSRVLLYTPTKPTDIDIWAHQTRICCLKGSHSKIWVDLTWVDAFPMLSLASNNITIGQGTSAHWSCPILGPKFMDTDFKNQNGSCYRRWQTRPTGVQHEILSHSKWSEADTTRATLYIRIQSSLTRWEL